MSCRDLFPLKLSGLFWMSPLPPLCSPAVCGGAHGPGCGRWTVRDALMPDSSSLLPAHRLVQMWHCHSPRVPDKNEALSHHRAAGRALNTVGRVLISAISCFADGIPVQSSSRILISSTLKHFQLLTILSVHAEDFGIYTCVATNSLGSASTSCVIRKAGERRSSYRNSL